MKFECGCGFIGFVEKINTACPKCSQEMQQVIDQPRMIDFEEYRRVLEAAFLKMKPSVVKHGDWSDYELARMFDVTLEEIDELREAMVSMDINGRHGVIMEAYDVIVVLTKLIKRLSIPVSGI